MSKTGFITVRYPDLSGGQNDMDKINDNQASYLRNTRTDGLSTVNRDGYTLFADTITTTGDINGIASYLPFSSTNDKIVMAVDDNLYYATPTSTAWTAITDADALITVDTDMSFVNYGDYLICMDVTDEVGVIGITDTVTYEEPGAAAVKLGFGAAFTEQLFASGNATNPNNVYYGRSATSANPEYIYAIGGTANGAGIKRFPNVVRAIKAANQALYIFTDKETFITRKSTTDWDFSTAAAPVPLFNTVSGFGCAGKDAAVVVGNDVYYLTPDNEIRVIRYTTGGALETPAISDIISSTMATLDEDQSACKAEYYPVKRLIKFFVKTDGAAFNDLHLIYDLSVGSKGKPKEQWLVDNHKHFSCSVHYKGKMYCGSDLEGKVYIDEDGDYADGSNTPIIYERWSKEFDFENPTARKRFREMRFVGEINDNTSFTFSIYIDGVNIKEVTVDSDDINAKGTGIGTYEIGEYAVGEGGAAPTTYEFIKIIKFRETGKKIQYRIKNDGVGQYLKINYVDIELKALDKLQHKISNIN